jgi:hypothetical protein
MKKQTLSILPLVALLAAGCTSDDAVSRTTSPWAQEGTGGQPHPIARTITVDDDQYSPDSPLEEKKFPRLTRDKAAIPAPASKVDRTPPEDQRRLRVTDVRENHALFEFVSNGQFKKDQKVNVDDGKSAARVRIVAVDGKTIVAEILPNNLDLPRLELGSELAFVSTDEVAAAAGAPAPAAEVPAVPEVAPAATASPAPEPPPPAIEEPPAPAPL